MLTYLFLNNLKYTFCKYREIDLRYFLSSWFLKSKQVLFGNSFECYCCVDTSSKTLK